MSIFTDPESGISVSSNGSSAAESFISTFQAIVKASNELKQAQKDIINAKYGFVYFVNPDGWADKCKQKGDNSYEGVLDLYPNWLVPKVGELLCIGWLGDEYNQNFVIYKIVKVELQNQFFPNLRPMIYGEEVEEFSTKVI
ncbi:MAG: hypothetical protein ABFC34_03550 [Methanobacterium sp.]